MVSFRLHFLSIDIFIEDIVSFSRHYLINTAQRASFCAAAPRAIEFIDIADYFR
jgi:hypothetical protein